MEEPTQIPPHESDGQCRRARVVACFEEAQTVGILNYLSVQNHIIKYQSVLKDHRKKCREFQFDQVFIRDGKMVAVS